MGSVGRKPGGSQIGVRGILTWLRILRPARLLSKLDPNKNRQIFGDLSLCRLVTQAIACGMITGVAEKAVDVVFRPYYKKGGCVPMLRCRKPGVWLQDAAAYM